MEHRELEVEIPEKKFLCFFEYRVRWTSGWNLFDR